MSSTSHNDLIVIHNGFNKFDVEFIVLGLPSNVKEILFHEIFLLKFAFMQCKMFLGISDMLNVTE